MATTVYGRVQPFSKEETITAYLEQMSMYFELLKMSRSWTLLLKNQKAVVIAERFWFYRRDQAAEETIAEFVAALRKLATHCTGEFLSALHDRLVRGLRDETTQIFWRLFVWCPARLVRGLRDETTQKRLLSEASLTLTEAIAISQSQAGDREQVRKLKSPSQAAGELWAAQWEEDLVVPSLEAREKQLVIIVGGVIQERLVGSRMQRVIVVANLATLPSWGVQRREKESLLGYNFVVCLKSWANCIIILVFCFPRSNDIRASGYTGRNWPIRKPLLWEQGTLFWSIE